MEDNKQHERLTQRDYQRKYDKKTKTISIKYSLSDMDDYNRLKDYLEKTNQSVNGFIKSLINDFFERGNGVFSFPPPKECEKMEFFKYSEISVESFDKLKAILQNDEQKYNIVLDMYAKYTKDEIESAQFDKACEFEEWIDRLESDIEDGDINMESDSNFKKDIEESMCSNLREIMYG